MRIKCLYYYCALQYHLDTVIDAICDDTHGVFHLKRRRGFCGYYFRRLDKSDVTVLQREDKKFLRTFRSALSDAVEKRRCKNSRPCGFFCKYTSRFACSWNKNCGGLLSIKMHFLLHDAERRIDRFRVPFNITVHNVTSLAVLPYPQSGGALESSWRFLPLSPSPLSHRRSLSRRPVATSMKITSGSHVSNFDM